MGLRIHKRNKKLKKRKKKIRSRLRKRSRKKIPFFPGLFLVESVFSFFSFFLDRFLGRKRFFLFSYFFVFFYKFPPLREELIKEKSKKQCYHIPFFFLVDVVSYFFLKLANFLVDCVVSYFFS